MTRLEILAIPLYGVTMGAEKAHHNRRMSRGERSAGDYESRDTWTSLAMGAGSLLVPLITPKLIGPITPGKGRYGRHLVGIALGAASATTAADAVVRRSRVHDATDEADVASPATRNAATAQSRRHRIARTVARISAPLAIAAGSLAATTAWQHASRPSAMWRRGRQRDLGTGVVAWGVALVGWDLLYYANHRMWHSTRFMWANHVMHHSSEHYNLSTALRQAVTDPLLFPIPYASLCLLGVRPELVASSRSINLLYQYWIHTDAIDRLGAFEAFGNTPSHHRVHHGVNSKYIDRNHGGMLIIWDRIFGTFTREDEHVVYGLTKNIKTFNPLRVASHEYVDILRDVADATNWRDRLSFTFRGPGWAYERHRIAAALGPIPSPESKPIPSHP